MVAVAWDTSNLKVLTVASGKSCTSCCIGDCAALPSCLCDYADDDCECWSAGLTPKYLVVTFAGIRKCSDDSLWAEFNTSFCLTQTKVSNPTPCAASAGLYVLYTTVDGNEVCIVYGAAEAGESYVLIYTDICPGTCPCFFESFGDICDGAFINGLEIGNCDEDNLAYDGTATMCNPCTGTWL